MAELTDDQIRDQVRERYAAAATAASRRCGCAPGEPSAAAGPRPRSPTSSGRGLRRLAVRRRRARRSVPRRRSRPRSAAAYPTAVADLHDGEIVLDLGSGAGIDVLLSRPPRRARPARRYGLDMTDEMLELARANAARGRRRQRRVPQGLHRGRSRCPTPASTSSSPTASSTCPPTSRRCSARGRARAAARRPLRGLRRDRRRGA